MEQPPLVFQRLGYALGLLALLVVAVLSLMPSPVDISNSDKLLHLVTYATLAAWFSLVVCGKRDWLLAMLGLTAYGIGLEWLQGLTGYRLFEVADMLANSAGVLLGSTIALTPLPGKLRVLEQTLLRGSDDQGVR